MRRTLYDDADLLMTLTPGDIAAYLLATGWSAVRRIGDKGCLWTKNIDGDELEILLPLSSGLGDFAARVAEILRVLEVAEDRPQPEIIANLRTMSLDIVRLRLQGPQVADGTLPVEAGVSVVKGIQDLFVAAACAAITPQPIFPARRPARVVDYLRDLRLGQIEAGSFVVNVVSRIRPSLSSQPALPSLEDDPFERRVTTMLAVALEATKRAASNAALTHSMEEFTRSVGEGVSANLCEALAEISAACGRCDVSVTFSWARVRPQRAKVPHQVTLTADLMPFVEEAGRTFKRLGPLEEFELRGHVIRLERPRGALVGTVTILGLVNGEPRKVRLELPSSEYATAIQAHQEGVEVMCRGTLWREPAGFVLGNPHGLRRLEQPLVGHTE